MVEELQNDSADIKCGGAPVLGFDFYVDADENPKEMEAFITAEIAKNKLPLISIHSGPTQEMSKKSMWTRELISKCIKDEAPGMRV